jgi:hypothetical protein
MKKTATSKGRQKALGELRGEYRFDYAKAQPNRFAGRVDKDRVIVVLDPDIADVFRDGEAVNRVLRALITSMPPSAAPKRTRRSSKNNSL